ncbi:MAG: hypothetical protein E7413_02620 [Ruminococcaceae bacterium]|nr:hypothetical protein [Oscillospiraceae bacterium]
MNKETTNVDEQQEEGKLRLTKTTDTNFLKSKWIWMIVGIVVILLGVTYLYHIEVFPIYPPAKTVHYTANEHPCGIYLQDTYYFTTSDGVKAVDIKGRDAKSEIASSIAPFLKAMTEPIFEKSNQSILVYDIRGTSALLYDDTGIVSPFNFNGQIIRARMNADGDFVVIVDEDGSKSAVKLYDMYGNEKFTWYSGTGYVVDATINPENDTMAVLTNEISETGVTAKVLFFKMDNPEPVKGQVVDNQVGASVSYVKDKIYVLCANGLYLLEDGEKADLICDVSNRELKTFDYFTDGSALLCFGGDTVDTYQCEVYDLNGKRTAQFGLTAFVKIGDIADDKFVVHTRKEFFNVTKRGKIIKSEVMDYDIHHVSYFQNRVAVMGYGEMTLQ